MKITIREYVDTDRTNLEMCVKSLQKHIVEIDPLHQHILSPGYAKEYTDKLLKAVSEREGKIYFAQIDGEIVGFIAGTIQQESYGGTVDVIPSKPAWVRELYTDSRFRKKGVGTILMKTLEDYFKVKNRDIILLNIFATNTESHSFYESKGYVDRDITMLKKI